MRASAGQQMPAGQSTCRGLHIARQAEHLPASMPAGACCYQSEPQVSALEKLSVSSQELHTLMAAARVMGFRNDAVLLSS